VKFKLPKFFETLMFKNFLPESPQLEKIKRKIVLMKLSRVYVTKMRFIVVAKIIINTFPSFIFVLKKKQFWFFGKNCKIVS
jgi:hypothetical protein